MYNVIQHATNDFSASQSSALKISKIDRSPSTIPFLHSQFEEGPPLTIKKEMSETFSPLPSSELPAMTTAPLPHGPVLISGIYYQPVPAPHNVVVTQSAVLAPTVVPCVPEPAAPEEQPVAPEKPKVGLEFAMPETPPSKKSIIDLKLTNRSRSNSRQREKRKAPPKASPEHSTKAKPEVRPTERGRGKKRPEMTNAPILVPTTHSHLISAAKPKPGLTDSFTSGGSILPTVQHLSKLTIEAVTPLETNGRLSEETTVTLELTPIHDDSDMDLETSEIRVPIKASAEPSKLTYKLQPNTNDHEVFTQTIVSREAPLWDREKVRSHADLFYHSYFQDFQLMSDLKQKAQSRIQSFNVRVTRQNGKNDRSSNQANIQRLEAKFRNVLRQMYEAFEEAYTLEQPELIADLQDHLVKPAVAQIISLFVSSRCRTCYGGRHQTAAWRLSRFDTLAPLLCKVPNEAYKKAEDHQAVVILEKTRIEADGPNVPQFRLPYVKHPFFSLTHFGIFNLTPKTDLVFVKSYGMVRTLVILSENKVLNPLHGVIES